MVVEELKPIFEECNIIGDNAISIVIYETKGSMLGSPNRGRFKYLRNWRTFDNQIQIIS